MDHSVAAMPPLTRGLDRLAGPVVGDRDAFRHEREALLSLVLSSVSRPLRLILWRARRPGRGGGRKLVRGGLRRGSGGRRRCRRGDPDSEGLRGLIPVALGGWRGHRDGKAVGVPGATFRLGRVTAIDAVGAKRLRPSVGRRPAPGLYVGRHRQPRASTLPSLATTAVTCRSVGGTTTEGGGRHRRRRRGDPDPVVLHHTTRRTGRARGTAATVDQGLQRTGRPGSGSVIQVDRAAGRCPERPGRPAAPR